MAQYMRNLQPKRQLRLRMQMHAIQASPDSYRYLDTRILDISRCILQLYEIFAKGVGIVYSRPEAGMLNN